MLKAVLPAAALLAAHVPASAGEDGRVLGLDEALALKERLEDDVLLLTRLRDVQESLFAFNTSRAMRGLPPVTVPGELCAASPLEPLCPDLPATFSRSVP